MAMQQPPKVELTIKGDVHLIRPALGDKILVAMDGRLPREYLIDVRDRLQALYPRNEVIILAGTKGVALLEADRDTATKAIG